jgi:hypothetical protein
VRTEKKAEKTMTRILPVGGSNGMAGFILLRSLLIISAIILCAAIFSTTIAVFTRQNALLGPVVENELNKRNILIEEKLK